ncbi:MULTISPECIES: hypothetical protein [Actinoplanes]|uniref:hypothetical protein n=1 Tax=Actinoplanes TaxID=1865 RepID=UPI0005F286E0|nr:MULTISPECIES: hypothetical protein [Actinoplanes]GLY00423.1 hypothetical protein Acsp01_08020 [Actinoplanes sp. NBRC 101535]
MTDPARGLRWYAPLAVLFFGVLPAVMVSLLVLRGNTPSQVGYLLIVGIPLVVVAVLQTIRGVLEKDPVEASRRLNLGMALVAGADVLLLGGNALIRMSVS